MKKLGRLLKRAFASKAGISSVEYALLLAFVATAITVAAGTLSQAVEDQLNSAACYINTGADCPAG